MTSTITHTSVDCANAYELSEWWKQVLAYVDLDGDPNLPGHDECMIRSLETGHHVLTLADPEGNEFCVLRSDAERAVGATS